MYPGQMGMYQQDPNMQNMQNMQGMQGMGMQGMPNPYMYPGMMNPYFYCMPNQFMVFNISYYRILNKILQMRP